MTITNAEREITRDRDIEGQGYTVGSGLRKKNEGQERLRAHVS